MMKSSAADTVLKHWFVVMKKRAPILKTHKKQKPPLICLSSIHMLCVTAHFRLLDHLRCSSQQGAVPSTVRALDWCPVQSLFLPVTHLP